MLEPGRFIVGNAGILVSRVIYTKESGEKQFVIQDAAMNDLIRPTLYESFHRIWPVAVPAGLPAPPDDYEAAIAGHRALGRGRPGLRERRLPGQGPRPARRSAAATCWPSFSAGAYGMAMASNYNSRPRAAEVLVDGAAARLIRRRETYEDLVLHELDAVAAAIVKAARPRHADSSGEAHLRNDAAYWILRRRAVPHPAWITPPDPRPRERRT